MGAHGASGCRWPSQPATTNRGRNAARRQEGQKRREVVLQAVIKGQADKAIGLALADAGGELAEGHEPIVPLTERVDVSRQIGRAREEGRAVAPHRHIADAVVDERERGARPPDEHSLKATPAIRSADRSVADHLCRSPLAQQKRLSAAGPRAPARSPSR